jgi:hypothetical protein
LPCSGRGLVDLLVACRRALGAHGNRGADRIELEVAATAAVVISVSTSIVVTVTLAVLEDADLVLGVAGVGYALYPDALVRVVSSAGDL